MARRGGPRTCLYWDERWYSGVGAAGALDVMLASESSTALANTALAVQLWTERDLRRSSSRDPENGRRLITQHTLRSP